MKKICDHHDTEIVRYRWTDGSEDIKEKCLTCKWVSHAYKRSAFSEEVIAKMRVIETKKSHPCEVKGCKNTTTRRHHWFPCSLANAIEINPNQWPTSWLCLRHEEFWHTMVTPNLNRKSVPKLKEEIEELISMSRFPNDVRAIFLESAMKSEDQEELNTILIEVTEQMDRMGSLGELA